jgi:hypothetical protein
LCCGDGGYGDEEEYGKISFHDDGHFVVLREFKEKWMRCKVLYINIIFWFDSFSMNMLKEEKCGLFLKIHICYEIVKEKVKYLEILKWSYYQHV